MASKEKTVRNRGTRPGLSREESRQLTRARLLSTGRTEFACYGLAGANLTRILKNAEVSPGAFYHHYKDKVELFLAIADEAAVALRGLLRQTRLVRSDDHPIRWIEEHFGRILHFVLGERELFTIIFRELHQPSDPRIAAFSDRDREMYVTELEEDLRKLVSEGVIPKIDVAWASRLTVWMIISALNEQLQRPRDESEWVRAVARYVLFALPGMRHIESPETAVS
jgi:AcrR family transcriptional regulator